MANTETGTASRAEAAPLPLVSVVVIGRNEGERLSACLASVQRMRRKGFACELIYVDSASTDGSPERAAALGAEVIRRHPLRLSAALARNAGWQAAAGEWVLFLDGDTELDPDFVASALPTFADPTVAVVWGHRREKCPEQSVYVRVLDFDWLYPPGDSAFCGGDALMRRSALAEVGGFDSALIAGEEPELCRRLRSRGGRIVHLDLAMTRHDLAIRDFAAYWRRAFRSGHAYAEVAARFAASSDPLWRREARRNLLHAGGLLAAPGLLAYAGLVAPVWAAAGLGLAALVLLRSWRRAAWKCPNWSDRWRYLVHSHLQQIPIFCGQLACRWHAWRGHQRPLIEYKAR